MDSKEKKELTEAEKQLKRIADSLEKIAKSLEPQSTSLTTDKNKNIHSILSAIYVAIAKLTNKK